MNQKEAVHNAIANSTSSRSLCRLHHVWCMITSNLQATIWGAPRRQRRRRDCEVHVSGSGLAADQPMQQTPSKALSFAMIHLGGQHHLGRVAG